MKLIRYVIQYAIKDNFGPNLFSLFDPLSNSPIFQIDANLGYPAALLVCCIRSPEMFCHWILSQFTQNALLQAPDVPNFSTPLTITLLPALPLQWPSGYITNARVRGGISVNMAWNNGRLSNALFTADSDARGRTVQIILAGKVVAEFIATSGFTKSIGYK